MRLKPKDIEKILKEASMEPTDRNIHQLIEDFKSYNRIIKRQEPDYIPNVYASEQFGGSAYGHVLNSASPSEAFIAALEEHEKDEDYLAEVRNQKYFYAKENVLAHDDHPVQKRMVKEGTMDRQALKKSQTLNQLLIKLYRQVSLQDKYDRMQGSIDTLQEEVRDLKIGDIKHTVHIESLQELLNHSEDPKDLAYEMYRRGFPQKDIAKAVDKTVRTVKRWCQEFKQLED